MTVTDARPQVAAKGQFGYVRTNLTEFKNHTKQKQHSQTQQHNKQANHKKRKITQNMQIRVPKRQTHKQHTMHACTQQKETKNKTKNNKNKI